MERTGELEPGVLSTFRLFIGVQLVISVLGVIAPWLIPFHAPAEVIRHMNAVLSSTAIFTQLTITAISSSLLFLYLSIYSLRHALKSFYLPVAIIWATRDPDLQPILRASLRGKSSP